MVMDKVRESESERKREAREYMKAKCEVGQGQSILIETAKQASLLRIRSLDGELIIKRRSNNNNNNN